MSIVRITGWQPGVKTVSLTQLIMRVTGYGLIASKHLTDRVLEGVVVRLPLEAGVEPAAVVKDLETLGAVASHEPIGANDAGRAYLAERGYPQHVIAGGVVGLLDAWENTAAEVARGANLDRDEYLNDMDARHILAEVLPHLESHERASVQARLNRLDAIIRPHLVPTPRCIWGEDNATKYGYDPERHWWYYHHPKRVQQEW